MKVTRALALGLLAAPWALGGCSGGSTSPISPGALTITGGNLQAGCPLGPLPESLEVTLTGGDGIPLAGTPVTWQVTGGSAALSSTVRPTDQSGRSRVQLTLGLALSPVAVRATAGAVPAATFSATGRVASYGLGQTTSSTLNGSSCTFVGGGPFDAYALTLPGAQAFTVSLTSGSFDAAVELVEEHFAIGGAFNLDSVPGRGITNSFLKMIAAGGAYGIAAASQNIGAAGSYTLTTAAVPVYADSCLDDIWVTRGIVTQQELKSTDCVDGTGPFYFDTFQLILVTGQSVTITESSTGFDAELFLHSSSGRVVSDDNGGGGTNARLSYTNSSSEAEVLHILPSTVAIGATGAYTLTIDPPAMSASSAIPPISPSMTRRIAPHAGATLRSR
jgi:Big-like domain-containing protein